MAASPGLAHPSTAAPRRVSSAEHTAEPFPVEHVGVKDVGGAQESGDERGGRRGVDLLGRAHLLDTTLGQTAIWSLMVALPLGRG